MRILTELAPGLKISRIITGLWQIADMERKEELDSKESAQNLIPYINSELTTFDMADHYGSSEKIIGELIKKSPNTNIQILTKWVPKPGKINKSIVRDAVELALKRTNKNSIDLMQYHAWHYPDSSWLDALFFLEELKNEGLIKHIGVTNFDSAHLRIACSSGISIISNQVSYSIIDLRANQSSMVETCKDYGVKLLAYGVLMGGFLTEKWLDKKEPKASQLKTWSEMKYKRFIDTACGWDKFQLFLNELKKVAKINNASIANICSRYVLDNKIVAGIIIGARVGQRNHIQNNLKILDSKISNDSMKIIDEEQKNINAIPGGCGDEYRKPPFLTASGDLSHHIEEIPKIFKVIDNNKLIKKVSSNTVWEKLASYSRAIKYKDRILVSGTTSTLEDKLIGGADAAAQTHFIIDKIEASIQSLGGNLNDIIKTRIFIKNLADWEKVAKAHGERFKGIMPVNTLVQANLIGDEYLVEIEAEAIISDKPK